MSEIPERKVLKQVLSNLKTKTISSQDSFKKSLGRQMQIFDAAEQSAEKLNQLQKDASSKRIHEIVSTLQDVFARTAVEALGLLDDLRIYIESLESYSTELDKTLSDIFEQARKQAEEQMKQQEELMKKGSTEYIK